MCRREDYIDIFSCFFWLGYKQRSFFLFIFLQKIASTKGTSVHEKYIGLLIPILRAFKQLKLLSIPLLKVF